METPTVNQGIEATGGGGGGMEPYSPGTANDGGSGGGVIGQAQITLV